MLAAPLRDLAAPLVFAVTLVHFSIMPGKYRLTTFGCKVNQNEPQVSRETDESCGCMRAHWDGVPNLVVVNRCVVIRVAMIENVRAVWKVARSGAGIMVDGCASGADRQRYHRKDKVLAVPGHDADLRREVPRRLAGLELSGGLVLNRDSVPGYTSSTGGPADAAANAQFRADAGGQRFGTPASPARHPSGRIIPLLSEAVKKPIESSSPILDRIDLFEGFRRAILKVQDACDALCTNCTVLQLRPILRRKPIPPAVAEASVVENEASQITEGHSSHDATGNLAMITHVELCLAG